MAASMLAGDLRPLEDLVSVLLGEEDRPPGDGMSEIKHVNFPLHEEDLRKVNRVRERAGLTWAAFVLEAAELIKNKRRAN